MELKLALSLFLIYAMRSFNCTFMELKYSNFDFTAREHGVLIVPLWN